MTSSLYDQAESTITQKLLWGTFVSILLIKALWLSLDWRPAYFLGDSQSYIDSAIFRHIPTDRSFTYGLFIRRIGVHLHSLEAVICSQALLSAVAAWLLCYYLVRFFGVRFWIAAAMSLLCSVEPLQLLMERYVMTETVATFLFVVYLGVVWVYLRRGDWPLLIAAQAIGVLLISIRIAFLPEVLLNTVLAPLLSPPARPLWAGLVKRTLPPVATLRDRRWRVVGTHLFIAIVFIQTLLVAYMRLYGHLTHQKPALLYANGYFLLADFMPVVKPEDFPVPAQRAAMFSHLPYDSSLITNRLAARWVEGDICDRIQKQWPGVPGNEIANTTAFNAMKRDPLGVCKLAWQEFLEYFNVHLFRVGMLDDEGWERVLPPKLAAELSERLGVRDPKGSEPALTKTWHRAGMPWYWFILCFLPLSPLLLFLCRRGRAEAPLMMIAVAAALLFFEGATLTVERPNARYLTTAAWLVLLLVGFALDRLLSLATYHPASLDT